jgi:flagellar biosynthesis protein FlhG
LRELAKSTYVEPSLPQLKRAPGGRCVSIAVASGKGGVGKTTVALVLAESLANLQKKVLLMDADLGLANIHILLGIAPRFNISHVVAGECGINDILVEAAPGVFLAPGASGLEQLSNIDAGRLEKLRAAFTGLEEGYDYLIMDTGAGIGSTVTGFARYADLVLLVMTPDPSSLADAYALVKVLYEKGNANVAVAVNMTSSVEEGRDAFERLNKVVVNFLKKPVELYAILLNDREVLRLGRRQRHLAKGAGGVFYKSVAVLARKLSGYSIAEPAGKGFFGKLFGGAS